MLTIDTKAGTLLKKREWDDDAGGFGVGKMAGLAIVLPVAGTALLLNGHVWQGILALFGAMAAIIMTYFWWTRPRQ